MARSMMPTMGGMMRWENDENGLSEQSSVQWRAGILSRPLPRMPLNEITDLFSKDGKSSRKRNSSRNCSAHASNRKRRVSEANSLKADRQSALLRKLR
ncbi:unnamed protein product [Calypogeia fissa]